MLLAWSASSSVVNKTIVRLTQRSLSKPFSLFHNTYIDDIKGFFQNDSFVQNLFYIKRFSKKIVFKFSKNVEWKIVNDPKIG